MVLVAVLARAQGTPALQLEQAIALSGVEGRLGHMEADLKKGRLFIPAPENGSVEVLDLRAARRIHSIRGLREPRGVLYSPGRDRLFVAVGGDGSCRIFGGISLQPLSTVELTGPPGHLRLNESEGRLFAGHGGDALAVLDIATGKRLGDIRLAGRPESFQLEGEGPRIFVNVPSQGHIAVVDRVKGAVSSVWPLDGSPGNYPMALDHENRLLFVGCRKPPKVLVFDTDNGKLAGSFEVDGEPGDVFHDARHKRVYVSCGAGFLNVLQQQSRNEYRVLQKVPTVAGALSSLYVPELDRVYLAIPGDKGREAEIRVYQVMP
jgi:DNA-binding beta-propeller fold protein YncE